MDKHELLEVLRNTEETILLEILEITSDELVDKFMDKIEENIDKLYEKAV